MESFSEGDVIVLPHATVRSGKWIVRHVAWNPVIGDDVLTVERAVDSDRRRDAARRGDRVPALHVALWTGDDARRMIARAAEGKRSGMIGDPC